VTVRINSNIRSLINLFKIVETEYTLWKFNSDSRSAFETNAQGKKTLGAHGAWRSPGFQHLVSGLTHWSSLPAYREDRTLGLAFVHPHLPPWNPYPFADEHGKRQTILQVTPERLAILQDLSLARASKHDLIDSGLQSFFQVAGINTLGTLIVTEETNKGGNA
jgi:hypothetical protein